jgi:ankyrin repeat protein
MTVLMDAVKANAIETVRKLIQEGADVNGLDVNGDAPLVIAAYEGHTEIVKMLLEAGADVRAVDPGMKATALHAAAYAGRTEAARLLIEYHIDIDKQGPYNGYTALHDAIWQNNIGVAKLIVEAGTNLEINSNDGQTPLEMAKARGRREIAAIIEQQKK